MLGVEGWIKGLMGKFKFVKKRGLHFKTWGGGGGEVLIYSRGGSIINLQKRSNPIK